MCNPPWRWRPGVNGFDRGAPKPARSKLSPEQASLRNFWASDGTPRTRKALRPPRASLAVVSELRELLPYEPALADAGRFGSREGGVPRPDSDLDLAVLHVEGRRLTHRELGEWRLRLSERYGLDADVVDLATADCLLRREVATRGRVFHAQGRQAWVDFVGRTLIDQGETMPTTNPTQPDPYTSILTMPLEELQKRVIQALVLWKQIIALFPGTVVLTAEERNSNAGRLRVNEEDALLTILKVADAFPEYFTSLADRDSGVDPAKFETELQRDRLASTNKALSSMLAPALDFFRALGKAAAAARKAHADQKKPT